LRFPGKSTEFLAASTSLVINEMRLKTSRTEQVKYGKAYFAEFWSFLTYSAISADADLFDARTRAGAEAVISQIFTSERG
jgi:hypothetical protein